MGASASQTGLGSAEAPEPCGLRPSDAIPSADDWRSISSELPPIGERVECRHELNPSYDCKGTYKGDGRWACANAFIVPPGFLIWNPTHWRHLPEQVQQ